MPAGARQRVGTQRPELQQLEGAATRDARLAVEEAAAVVRIERHVERERDEDERDDRRQEEQQRRGDGDVEQALGERPRHGRNLRASARCRSCTSGRPRPSPTRHVHRGSGERRS
jgi:hypothetical protein